VGGGGGGGGGVQEVYLLMRVRIYTSSYNHECTNEGW